MIPGRTCGVGSNGENSLFSLPNDNWRAFVGLLGRCCDGWGSVDGLGDEL